MSYPTLNYKYDYTNKIIQANNPDLYTKVGNFIDEVNSIKKSLSSFAIVSLFKLLTLGITPQ